MHLEKTTGDLSRVAKLSSVEVKRIRQLYSNGKRGKTQAKRFGISVNHWDKIGRRGQWEKLR